MKQTDIDREYHRLLTDLAEDNRKLRARNAHLAKLLTCSSIAARPSRLIEVGWCKYDYAKDMHGQPVPPHSERAVAWSLMGAICRARATGWQLDGVVQKIQQQKAFVGKPTLDQWNNRGQRTQEQVVQILKDVGA